MLFSQSEINIAEIKTICLAYTRYGVIWWNSALIY